MTQEYLIADFSGGINPSVQSDKLQNNEALFAQNVRLDEFGGVQSGPGSSVLSTISDTANNLNVHSLFVAPPIGCLAGVGQDVFVGAVLGGLTDGLNGANTSQQKISAASTDNRVFFSVNGVEYFVGGIVTTPLLVDWAPPGSTVTTTNGPFTVATSGTATFNATSPHWSNQNGIIGTGTATAQVTAISQPITDYLRGLNPAGAISTSSNLQGIQFSIAANVSASATAGFVTFNALLELNGVVVGSTRSQQVNVNSGAQTLTFGGGTADRWGTSLTSSQVNNATFGVRIQCVSSTGVSTPVNITIANGKFTFYQSNGTGITAGTGAAGILTGTYTWYVTFVGENGEESDLSTPTSPVALTAQQGSLTTIPLGDARTVSRNIYRSGNVLNSPYLVGSIADNISASYSDNQTDAAALTQGSIAAGAVAGDLPNSRLGGQQGKYPCFHYERVFWLDGNTLFWSKPLNPFAYPVNNFIPIGDAKPGVGLVSKWGCLIIIKTDSIWILSGADENTFTLTKSESIVGTDQSFTIAPISNGVLFANSQGVYVFNGAVSTKLTPKLDLLFRGESRGLIPALETTNQSATGNNCGAANGDFYYLAVAASGATSPTLLFVINMVTGTITTRSLQVLSLAVDYVSGFVYAGLANGQIIQVDNYNSPGNQSFSYQSKYTDAGNRGSNLVVWALEFWGNTNGAVVTPTISYDGGLTSEKLPSFSTTSNQRVERKFNASKSRLCQTVSIRLDGTPTTTGPIDMIHCKLFYDVHTGRARTGNVS